MIIKGGYFKLEWKSYEASDGSFVLVTLALVHLLNIFLVSLALVYLLHCFVVLLA